jgi:DNA (cytosine-5)-methyltransferase 1
MRFLSVCSGIEAASVAWNPLGWEAAAFAEIEKFPSAVLAHHYPNVPNLGDMTKFMEWPDLGAIDLVCGGTPCQDTSTGYSAGAGTQGRGLDGERSGLAFTFSAIVGRLKPKWFLWENVENTLSKKHGLGFFRLARTLAQSGYHIGWRVLDARWFGLCDQPRPRVFMVGHYAEPRAVAAVLFEPGCIEWDRQTVKDAAPVLTARGGMAFDDRTPCILEEGRARIATPLEWERSLGFPDDYTQIPWKKQRKEDCPVGPRYKALGNSWDIKTVRWIGERIDQVELLSG